MEDTAYVIVHAVIFLEAVGSVSSEVIVGLLSLCGTLLGSIAGIMRANQLTVDRIKQLEEKVQKHNHLVERVTAVEQSVKSAHHRIDRVDEALGGGNK